MQKNMIKIAILYSSLDYDEIIGKILETSDMSEFISGERVCVLLDYTTQCFEVQNEHIIVSERYVFHLGIDEIESAQIIPLIKYGTIACYIIQNYNVTADTKILINSRHNIFTALVKFFKYKTQFVSDKPNSPHNIKVNIEDSEDNITIIQDTNSITIPLNNFVNTFGLENIKKVIEFIVQNGLLADVIHISRGNSLSRCSSKSRFFDILDMKIM